MDEDDYDSMSPGTRAAAERELQRRDREEGTGRRDADDILYGLYFFNTAIVFHMISCYFLFKMNMMMMRHQEKKDDWLRELLLVSLLMMKKTKKCEFHRYTFFLCLLSFLLLFFR